MQLNLAAHIRETDFKLENQQKRIAQLLEMQHNQRHQQLDSLINSSQTLATSSSPLHMLSHNSTPSEKKDFICLQEDRFWGGKAKAQDVLLMLLRHYLLPLHHLFICYLITLLHLKKGLHLSSRRSILGWKGKSPRMSLLMLLRHYLSPLHHLFICYLTTLLHLEEKDFICLQED